MDFKRITYILLRCILSLGSASNLFSVSNRVAIKAEADVDYLKEREKDGSAKPMTYQVAKGKFYRGGMNDKRMEEFTFEDIVNDMVEHLNKQKFYPHQGEGTGDMLIVIHYGVTEYEESIMELMGYTSEEEMGLSSEFEFEGLAPDASSMNAIADLGFNQSTTQTLSDSNKRSMGHKAKLLGMEKAFGFYTNKQDEYELKSMLDEERYFVILMAYDILSIKMGVPKLLWTTRYSIRAIGQNFDDAIKGMNEIAGDYYGQSFKGLNLKRLHDDSKVEIGDIEVIDEEKE
jgi:hypothetical protein